MESRHCPYLALPNMVRELMLDSIFFSWLYRWSAIFEPTKINLSQRMESEPRQFHTSLFILRLRPTRPFCSVRRVHHCHFARPIEAHYASLVEPNICADLSHTVSPPVNREIQTVRANWYGDWYQGVQSSYRTCHYDPPDNCRQHVNQHSAGNTPLMGCEMNWKVI